MRVRDSGVTFDGSTSFGKGASTYTVTSSTQTEANRAIIIGVGPGENASLTVSHSSIVCCGVLSSLSGVAATLGDSAGASGTLNMNVGTFNVTGSDFTQTQLIVGNNGNGTLNVNNGADVHVSGFNSTVALGHHSTGNGTVSINGAGSTWTNDDQLWIGESGTGTLTIENGGSLITSSGAGNSSIIGVFGGSNGMVTITGAGSTWNDNNGLTVGNSGNGTLLITNGGSLTSTGTSLGGRLRRERHGDCHWRRLHLDRPLDHHRHHRCRRAGDPKRRQYDERQRLDPRPQQRVRSSAGHRRRFHVDGNDRAAHDRST